MQQRLRRISDIKIRLCGAALILLAALCLYALPADRGNPAAQPSGFDLCVGLLAVCSGFVGAAFVFEGRSLFEPVTYARARREVRDVRDVRDDAMRNRK